jgi:hypothetical protein
MHIRRGDVYRARKIRAAAAISCSVLKKAVESR